MIDDLRRHGWRQGAILPAASHAAIQIDLSLNDSDCCIVASQSCDILCEDFTAEPYVDLVIARPISGSANGNYTFAKNARRLHLDVTVKGDVGVYEALASDRRTIRRQLLATHGPDIGRRLSPEAVEHVIQWLVSRYRRKAFPDEFNARTHEVFDRKVKPRLQRLAQVTALYVALNSWEELQSGMDYKLSLLATMLRSQYADPALRAAVEKGMGEIANFFRVCPGIDVDDFAVRSEADVTLDEVRHLARWHLDYITLRDTRHTSPP